MGMGPSILIIIIVINCKFSFIVVTGMARAKLNVALTNSLHELVSLFVSLFLPPFTPLPPHLGLNLYPHWYHGQILSKIHLNKLFLNIAKYFPCFRLNWGGGGL